MADDVTSHGESETHHDSAGSVRVRNRFGFNSFATVTDAVRYATSVHRPGTHIWVVELDDGTFDYVLAEPSPDRPKALGGFRRIAIERNV